MGYWCPVGEGHADAKDPDVPEKLSIYFDTPTGKKFGTKPGWILKTDYTKYDTISTYRSFFYNFIIRS